ncbi:ParB N-terminal domain-containing protein [Agrobacterium vitis]|uniref:ParB/RepB/Spo0J family partition protein n=1 Tax=Rhizobium/Agrobacterium group TaxID=227290 RepID=UPI001F3A0AA6|nr:MULTISPECIES: ParB/RepB/Spo0J family partition protein [Rhizobium/Agrobacterium group]MCF1501703.1 chromosome partitioning protein ParB [Allorhizobium sp. Av2]MCM2438511.1 ParB N-terminal domain-containing protein [Agrobacterium vitis]MCM2473153.1 ParB N-terminal domain-containing protein [Rhizobium sp. CG5]
MTTTANSIPTVENGATVFIPLNKLKKHPKNARKTPHSEASIEAKAASIAAKGILQNLVVEPELDAAGEPTGGYLVTIGEGRRLAQMLRVKRKEIKKTEPIRCVIDTANDAAEISLDENVTRENLHPADEYERFRELSENHGWGAEEIAARFGVSPHVVKQRMRLGAVSPKLLQAYRDGELTLDQLMAFAITDDHARQEHVYQNLSYNRDPSIIRRDLTKMNVAATDRRAVFVGAQAYAEAGGNIIRDLFTEDRGGFFEDPALLDRLAIEKLEWVAAEVQEAEGWKWTAAYLDFPHAHGMHRVYPHSVELSEADAASYDAAQDELERLTAEWEDADIDLPSEVDARFAELEAEIERINALRHAYDPDEIARGGVFVVVAHDGQARIERGFIRAEDEAPEPEAVEDGETVIDGVRVNGDGEIIDGDEQDGEGDHVPASEPEEEDAGDDGKPLPDSLIRDLTAHRTLGLRLALGEQPDMALIAVIHTLAAQTFYKGGGEAHCLEIRPTSNYLAAHADGIEDTAAAKMLADRHAGWAADMPCDVADLWGFVAGLDYASLMALLAHCASLTVNAVKLPWETSKRRAHETADKLATAVTLDMTAHWTPTVRAYLGRVTKAHILAAVREALGDEAAERIADMKKPAMAETAEQLLAGTGWLPPVLRTERPEAFATDADVMAPEAQSDDHFVVAAE